MSEEDPADAEMAQIRAAINNTSRRRLAKDKMRKYVGWLETKHKAALIAMEREHKAALSAKEEMIQSLQQRLKDAQSQSQSQSRPEHQAERSTPAPPLHAVGPSPSTSW